MELIAKILLSIISVALFGMLIALWMNEFGHPIVFAWHRIKGFYKDETSWIEPAREFAYKYFGVSKEKYHVRVLIFDDEHKLGMYLMELTPKLKSIIERKAECKAQIEYIKTKLDNLHVDDNVFKPALEQKLEEAWDDYKSYRYLYDEYVDTERHWLKVVKISMRG